MQAKEEYTIKRIPEADEWAVVTIAEGKVTADERFGPGHGRDAVKYPSHLYTRRTIAALESASSDWVLFSTPEQFDLLKADPDGAAIFRQFVKSWWRGLVESDQETLWDAATAYRGDGITAEDVYELYHTGKINLGVSV